MTLVTDTPLSAGQMARSMQPIIDVLGFDMALTLAGHFGGTRISLSRNPRPGDPICMIIGLDNALRLVRSIGAGQLEIPRCQAWLLGRRDEEIVARFLSGETHASLARRFGLTERHIRRVLGQDESINTPGPAPQPDLFTAMKEATP